MPIFSERFYDLKNNRFDVQGYEMTVLAKLIPNLSKAERDQILKEEVVEITRHITEGIRDLVRTNRRIRKLVLEDGAVPLSSWTESLDTLAEYSIPKLKEKIHEMDLELEKGYIGGFPGTLFLSKKPTFATFRCFYEVIFDLSVGC